MIKDFKQYIGKRFIVNGFNEPRELEIVEGYFLDNSKRYPAVAVYTMKAGKD
jgi:hypothetical protein